MKTDIFAPHKAVDRIPFFQGRGTTSTSSGDVSGLPYEWATFAKGFDYSLVVEPIIVQEEGIDSVIQTLAKRLAQIPDVLAVAYSVDRNIFLVWTFIRERNKEIRRQVYRQELQLMEEFSNMTFDFNVVALDQALDRPLLPDDLQGRIVFYREAFIT